MGYKYFDDFGAYLAALLTYYGFVSLFPLLLLLSTVLGFVLSGDQRLQHEVLTSALHQFPLIGGDLARPRHLGGGTIGLVVGILGCLYGGLGVAQAFQYATNTVWGVPRNNRPNPFHARGRSLVLLATTGLALMGTTVLSILGGGGVGAVGAVSRGIALAASVAIGIVVSVFAFRFAAARRLSVRDVAPGAIGAAVTWQVLQLVGVFYVRHVVRHATDTDAVFAIVLGLVAFLYVNAMAVLLVHGDQRRARQSHAPAVAADPVHRQRDLDPRRPARLYQAGQGPAQQGLPARRRQLRPATPRTSARPIQAREGVGH